MNDIYFIHSLDLTTAFLSIFQENFRDNFFVIEPNNESVENSLVFISKIPDNSIIMFLGHGHSTGLYTPEATEFEKQIFINATIAENLFKNKKIILLSCNSNQFIKRLKGCDNIIGFGNILSSMREVSVEAEHTGIYRDVNQENIDYFNNSYCESIISTIKLIKNKHIEFDEIPKTIEFLLNKKINEILLNKTIKNRTEISKLFYEFRNELVIKK